MKNSSSPLQAIPVSLWKKTEGNDILSASGWHTIIVMISLFISYLLGTWLIQIMSLRLRSISFIKSVHLLVFVLVSGLLVAFLYEVVVGKITYITWITVAVFLAEGVVLIANGWRGPLTAVAENLGSMRGQVTDILLPKWFADRVWTIYTWLFAGALSVLIWRLLS